VARTSRNFPGFEINLNRADCGDENHVCVPARYAGLCTHEVTEGTDCRRLVDECVWEVSLTKDGSLIDLKKVARPLNTAYVIGVNKCYWSRQKACLMRCLKLLCV
jgi:hypothetical protein